MSLLEDVAAARHVSVDEVLELATPDLGLEARGRAVLDFGPRKFSAGFDASGKATVRDASGELLPKLPAATRADDAARAAEAHRRWKSIKVDGETALKEQAARFEAAMCMRRTWSVTVFRKLLANPLLALLMRRIVWAPDEGAVTTTFRVAEDDSLADARDSLSKIGDSAQVRIPHPVEMATADLEGWSRVLGDYEIVQPFPQIGRPFFTAARGERSADRLARFKDMPTSRNRIFGLRHLGWNGTGRVRFESHFGVEKVVGGGKLIVYVRIHDLQIKAVELRSIVGSRTTFGRLDAIAFSELVRDLEWARA
jgi:hypothetical protein